MITFSTRETFNEQRKELHLTFEVLVDIFTKQFKTNLPCYSGGALGQYWSIPLWMDVIRRLLFNTNGLEENSNSVLHFANKRENHFRNFNLLVVYFLTQDNSLPSKQAR